MAKQAKKPLSPEALKRQQELNVEYQSLVHELYEEMPQEYWDQLDTGDGSELLSMEGNSEFSKAAIDILVDTAKRIYKASYCDPSNYCVEGGDMVGTTSTSKAIAERFSDQFLWACEPSPEQKPALMKQMESLNKLSDEDLDDLGSEYIQDQVINSFLKDRKKNEETRAGRPTIVDRGMISTIIYQSELNREGATLHGIQENCDKIVNRTLNMGISVPFKTVVLCSTGKLTPNEQIEVFSHRIGNADDSMKPNELDKIQNVLITNAIYSNVCMILAEEIKSIEVVEFSLDLVDVIEETIEKFDIGYEGQVVTATEVK